MKHMIIILSLALCSASVLAAPAEQETAGAVENEVALNRPIEAWWSGRTAGWIGGITGTVIGCMGALVGTLASFCKARRLVFFLLLLMFIFGVGSLILGLTAVFLSQPYAVYYGPFLLGLPCGILPLILYRQIRKQYEEKELRKMKSVDIY